LKLVAKDIQINESSDLLNAFGTANSVVKKS